MSDRSFQAAVAIRRVRKAIARSSSIRPIYLARWVFIAAAGCPLPDAREGVEQPAKHLSQSLRENRQRGFPTQEVWSQQPAGQPDNCLEYQASWSEHRRNAQIAQYFREGVHVNPCTRRIKRPGKETAVVSQFLHRWPMHTVRI